MSNKSEYKRGGGVRWRNNGGGGMRPSHVRGCHRQSPRGGPGGDGLITHGAPLCAPRRRRPIPVHMGTQDNNPRSSPDASRAPYWAVSAPAPSWPVVPLPLPPRPAVSGTQHKHCRRRLAASATAALSSLPVRPLGCSKQVQQGSQINVSAQQRPSRRPLFRLPRRESQEELSGSCARSTRRNYRYEIGPCQNAQTPPHMW